MARRRQRKKNIRNRGGPHGDGFGDQGDLLDEAGAEFEGAADPDAPAVSGPEGEAEPASEPGGQVPAEAASEAAQVAESEPEPEGAVEAEPEAELEPEAAAMPEREPGAAAAAPLEAEAEAEPDSEPEPEAAAMPEPEATPGPESGSERTPEAEVEPAGEAEPDSAEAEPDSESEAAAMSGFVPAAMSDPATEPEVDPAPEPESDPEPAVTLAQEEALVEARQLAADGQVERALDRVHAVVEGDPESVPLLRAVGEVLGHLARFDEAERYLKRAQRLAPDDVAVRAGLGVLAFRRGLYPQAEVELRHVCERHPDHAEAHYYRGEALNRLGRVDEALDVLSRAVELMPHDPRPFHTLGRLHDRKSQPEEAARMYRRARELNQP